MFTTADEMMALMSKEEKLCADLRPHVAHNKSFKFISHPLIQEVPFMDDKRCALINRRYEEKKKALARAVEEKNWNSYVFIHERPYRFNALMTVLHVHQLRDEVLKSELVASVWIDSENIWQNHQQWKRTWASLKKPSLTMEADELKALKAMPDILTVYRGIGAQTHNPNGLSWTLSKEKAVWFAQRFKRISPTLISGQVKKVDVYAYFTGRNEQEIVVDPRKIERKEKMAL